ncbi:MAG: NADH-quinone oxidoreductase subunit M [Verrucomicrobiota bacterium]|nr:NADH-quinone oxidoreductase subunit M [Verrucomicrobiota bacterium]
MTALLTVILSFIGALICGLMPASSHQRIRWVALTTALAGFAISIFCYLNLSDGKIADEIKFDWIPSIGISFITGYDGISLPLLLVTGLVAICGVLFSWNIDTRANHFYAFYFALIGGVYGVFLSLDLFLLFVFYEIAVVPKYFLIAIWGGAKRHFAAMKLVLYSFGGSALVLLGMIALFFLSKDDTGKALETFSIVEIQKGTVATSAQYWIFPLLFLGFAILAGMWPFHTWAPTGHVAAPTATSMLLAGVVMKLGAYGCLRVAIGLLPEGAQEWATCIAIFAIINIVYGAFVALKQDDFKFVIGYSSVSHMGFVLLGLATLNEIGVKGAVLQMFSHGVIGALLFALVGTVIYTRTKTRMLDELHRLIDRMPGISWLFIAAGLASMGLPGFSGFISELYVLIGVWDSLSGWILAGAGFGILMTFGYTLVKIHEAFFRERKINNGPEETTTYPSMTIPEKIGATILLGASLLIGICPWILTDKITPSLEIILKPFTN